MRFRVWLETENQDKSNLRGEPYMVHKWIVRNLSGGLKKKYNKDSYLHLWVRYIWDGYETWDAFAHRPWNDFDNKYPGEFGTLDVEESLDYPGWFEVGGSHVVKAFQQQGFGTEMYYRALELVKEKGFQGILSHKGSRHQPLSGVSPADKLWASLETSPGLGDEDYDYLENLPDDWEQRNLQFKPLPLTPKPIPEKDPNYRRKS